MYGMKKRSLETIDLDLGIQVSVIQEEGQMTTQRTAYDGAVANKVSISSWIFLMEGDTYHRIFILKKVHMDLI